MKSLKIFMTLLMSVSVLFFTACKDDKKDDPKQSTLVKPVYGEHFSVSVDGNDVTLACTMEAAAAVIWAVNDKEYTEKTVTVNIPTQGTYSVVLSVSADGLSYLESDPYEFEIETSDLTFLESGFWKDLTGGPEGGKVWVLDMEGTYFHAMEDYYGDAEAGAADADAWGPFGGGVTGGPNDALGGEISFDGATGTVTLTYDGETKSGQFSLDVKARPSAEDYMTYATDVKFDLWETGFVNGPYKYLDLSDEIATVKFDEGLHFPLDQKRFYNDEHETIKGQFLPADLETCDIVHIQDNAMVVRVKRTYEGDEESKCWMFYNYIVKGYEYEVKEDPVEPINTDFNAADLVGTWKLSEGATGGWCSWAEVELYDYWTERIDMLEAVTGWGIFGDPEEEETLVVRGKMSDAADKVQLVFNEDKTCEITNNIYDKGTDAEVLTTVNTTYSVDAGVITFADPIVINAILFELSGTELHITTVNNEGVEGLWLGYQNEEKPESSVMNIIKQ